MKIAMHDQNLLSRFRNQVEIFSQLTDDEILLILKTCSKKITLSEGEVVFREGAPAYKMFIILTGRVRIDCMHKEGVKESLAILEHGQSFGEMGLIDEAPRSGSATVASPECVLLILSKHDLTHLADNVSSKLYLNFAHALTRRLRAANHQTARLAASERVLSTQVKRLTNNDSQFRDRLRGANLRNADLTGADLRRADLRGSVLAGSKLRDINLRHSNFRGADLQQTSFVDVDFRGADFTGANLTGAVFRGTNLDESRFTAAQVEQMRIQAEIGEEVVRAAAEY